MKTQLIIVMLILLTTQAYSQEMINFSGVVKDSQTGKTLEEINVIVTEKNTGTITDVSGAFFIFLPGGIYNVSFSGNGYKPENIIIDLRSERISEIELTPSKEGKKKSIGSWLKKKPAAGNEIIAENTNQNYHTESH